MVDPDPCGSDHFPIILENCGPFGDGKGSEMEVNKRQIGNNFSFYAALICTNLPLRMLMVPGFCLLLSWRTLQKNLFRRLWQYQSTSINHGLLILVKMQSMSATGLLRYLNVNQPWVTRIHIALLGLRLAEISDTVRKHLGEIISTRWILKHRLNLYRIRSAKSRERNSVTLSVDDRDVTSHHDIVDTLADNFPHNSSSASSTDAFTSVCNKAES